MWIALPSEQQFAAWHRPSILRFFPEADVPEQEPAGPMEIGTSRLVPLRLVLPELREGQSYGDAFVIDRGDFAEYVYEVVQAPPPPPPPPIEISADVLFFDRMTDDEYEALEASVKAGETARVYRGWAAAKVFSEGTAMWTLLAKHLSLVVTDDRQAELLARPVQSATAPADVVA